MTGVASVPSNDTTAAPPSRGAVPTESALKATSRALKLLGEHFDTERGAYAAEWSDRRVAEETGLSLAAVASYRTECFGEILVDPALEQLQLDVVALEREVQSFTEATSIRIS